jgi:hypothetical protein
LPNGQFRGTQYLVGFPTGGLNNNVYFFSGIDGEMRSQSFSGPDPAVLSVNGKLAWAESSDRTCIFDATTSELDFISSYLYGSIGESSGLFKINSHIMTGYSTETQLWSYFAIPNNILACINKNYIGLCTARDAGLQDKFYAYNSYQNNLVELTPTGIGQVYSTHLGDNTALVVRDNMVYAFDPDAIGQNPQVLTFRSPNLNKAIIDFLIVHDELYIEPSEQLNSLGKLVGVSLLIDTVLHTSDSDLEFFLSHNGVTDTMIFHAGGSDSNFIGTQLNDDAANSINSGTAPFTGVYRPYKPLSVFNHQNPEGSWTLGIYDAAAGNTGTLKSWGLTLFFDASTDIEDERNEIVYDFWLSQNYPNPFNPATAIEFTLPISQKVALKVYDLLGREIETLIDEKMDAGLHELEFDGRDFASGIYFYQLETESFIKTRKMILLK